MGMNRREFLSQLGVAALASLVCSRQAKAARNKPNIILIVCDDLAIGDLGCYGQRTIRTPYIDAMASDGIRFTEGYASASWCAPSRCSLLTGLHQGHAHVRNSGGNLSSTDMCFTSSLKKNGYATAHIGKYGLGVPNSEQNNMPNHYGVDYFIGFTDHLHAHDSFPDFLWKQDGSETAEPVPLAKGTYVKKVSLSSTMGPGVSVDLSSATQA